MASGRVHSSTTLKLALPCALVAGWSYGVTGVTVSILGSLLALVLTPDLDQDGKTISDYWVRKTFGIIVETLWRIVWFPYARIVPHRHFMSHAPLVGTAIRFIYLGALLALLPWDMRWLMREEILAPLFSTVAVSDAAHWLQDR